MGNFGGEEGEEAPQEKEFRYYHEALSLMRTKIQLIDVYKAVELSQQETVEEFPKVDGAVIYKFRRSLREHLGLEALENEAREKVKRQLERDT